MANERADFRTPTQEADTPIIGAFGGLSSATYSTTGNVTHAQKMVNVFVNKRNEITRRQGSSIAANVQGLTTDSASFLTSHSFSFDNRSYMLVRETYNLRLLSFEGNTVVDVKTKANTFNSSAALERTAFTTVVEDNTCFVICTSRNSLPVVFTILKRDVFVSSKASSTSFTLSMNNYPANDVLTANKVLLYDSNNLFTPITTATQSGFSLNITTPTAFNEPLQNSVRVHLIFACSAVSAAYYPGLYLYNTAVRKNLVALDVNVPIPAELVSNPIINEPSIQNLSINTIEAYKTNGNPATSYTRVFTKQPNTVDAYDFSDGSYRVDPTLYTVRTPTYLGFGALQSPTNETRVFMFRWRSLATVLPNYFAKRSQFRLYVDKVLTTPSTYAQNGSAVTDDSTSAYYYSLGTNVSPGINLSAVVEIAYRSSFTSDSPIVDLTEAQSSVIIDDYFLFPFYGLSAISDVGGNLFPNICQTVGNRVVLSGFSNKIAVSDADWNYRGISWNNFQVSTIDFSASSAYLLSLTQSTSVVKSVISVSGVIFVGTDSGIYRISGESANSPPTATTVNVSRVSNEIVAGQSSMAIYSNRVFYVSKNGLYSLEYNKDNEEVNALPLSLEVSDYFTQFTANAITYSNYYRAFLISFVENNTVLAYMLETETFTTFKLSSNAVVNIIPTLDGYQANVNTLTPGFTNVLFCKWDASTTDLSNAISSLPAGSNVLYNLQTFTEAPTNNNLVTPAELIETLNPNLRQSYGKDTVRAIKGSITIAEGTAANNPLPIICAYVTKGFSQSKLIAANRVRAVNLLVSGGGTARIKVVYQSVDYNDRQPDLNTVSIGNTSGYQGDSFLNYQFAEQTAVGDNINIRVRVFGVSETWEVALAWDSDLKLLGFMFDTAAKKRGRGR